MAEISIDLPVVGADRNTWGTKLNDAMLAAVQAVNGSVTDLEVRAGNLIAIHVDDSETDLGPLPVAPGGDDAGVASYIATPGSDTQTALNAQIAQGVADDPEFEGTAAEAVGQAVDEVIAAAEEVARRIDIGPSAALMSMLETGAASCAVQVLGDSTGNDPSEWPRLLANWIAATYPALGVQIATWDDGTQRYPAPVQVRTPPLGPRCAMLGPGNNVWLFYPAALLGPITGDLDVAFHVAADDWTPASVQAFGGQFNVAGTRGWMLRLKTDGGLELTWSNDGTGTSSASSTAAITAADGTPLHVRCTLDVDNGASGRDIKFYTSTDGGTWTQLGATVTQAGTTTVFQPPFQLEIGARSNGSDFFKGKIYSARIRNGIDGPCVAPTNIESYRTTTNNATAVTWGGSPIVSILNASKAGADLAYLSDTTRIGKMMPDAGTVLALVSCSHNDGARLGPTLLADWDALLAKIKARAPMSAVVVVGQNPRGAPAQYIAQHAGRLAQLKAWAARNGAGFVDVYQAFIDHMAANGVTIGSLLDGAGIHPTDAAQANVWWPTIRAMLVRRS